MSDQPPTIEQLQAQLAEIDEKIAALEALRGSLPDDLIATNKQQFEAQKAVINAQIESGSLAIGEHAKAFGAHSVNVEGDVSGHMVGGQGNNVEFVANKVVQQLDPTKPKEEALREVYLQHLYEQCNQLLLAGIDPKAAGERRSLELGAVYTALLTQESAGFMGLGEVGAEMAAGKRGGGRRLSAVEQLNDHQKLVLLGDPGSGKSTFVNFVILCHVGQLLSDETHTLIRLTAPLPDEVERVKDKEDEEAQPQPWAHGPLLPLRIILRDFAARGLPAIGEMATADHLWQFVSRELKSNTLQDYVPYLQKHLREQGGLICFDGLDEVPAANERRTQIKQVVEAMTSAFPKCRVLVTSRTYAYQKQQWQLESFDSTVLTGFTKAQIAQFIDGWYAHMAEVRGRDAADAQGRANLLKETINNNRRLFALAERPLLLTLMASLHAWRGGSLPEKREELYADAVDLLLDSWEQQRVVRDGDKVLVMQPSLEQWLDVDRDKVRRLLNRLAYEAHQKQPELVGTADIAESELVMGLLKLSDKKDLPPLQLVEYLSDRAGLLVPRGVEVYTFPHRTFQEYLAACHLADFGYPDEVAELACADPNRWREVALLAGAKTARGGAFALWPLVNALCCVNPEESEDELADSWGAHLAGQALAETADLEVVSRANKGSINRVKKWLVHLMCGDKLPAVERAMAARHLAQLGDPRLEAVDVDEMHFCFVPAGPFLMGEDEDEPDEYIKWKPQHQVDLPYDYWIGRFPVTNAQFQPFVDGGGYAHEPYWPEAKKDGFWNEGQVRLRTYRNGEWVWETRGGPADYGEPFTLANHPRVGLSWYEALAYSRWLTDRWREAQHIPADWQVILASEAEWEKAARGGLEILVNPLIQSVKAGLSIQNSQSKIPNPTAARPYPWDGDTITAEHANYSPAEIGSPSGVGCFPLGISPVGCEEMGGNVLEWTRSIWDRYDREEKKFTDSFPYPYQLADGRENLEADDWHPRVMRLGLYGIDEEWSRCGSRYWNLPYLRNLDIGVRLVVVPMSLSAGL